MALADFNEVDRIVPNIEGNGNKVVLKTIPYYEEGENVNKIVFEFEDANGAIYNHGQLDPYGANNDALFKIGLSRLAHLLGAFMTDENYQKFSSFDEKSITDATEIITLAQELLAEDALEIEVDLLIAYRKAISNGKYYLGLPNAGSVISSKYKKKTLAFTPASKMVLRVPQVTADEESDSGKKNEM